MNKDEILQSLLDKYPKAKVRTTIIRNVGSPCEARALLRFLSMEGYRHLQDLDQIAEDIETLCINWDIKFQAPVQRTYTKP